MRSRPPRPHYLGVTCGHQAQRRPGSHSPPPHPARLGWRVPHCGGGDDPSCLPKPPALRRGQRVPVLEAGRRDWASRPPPGSGWCRLRLVEPECAPHILRPLALGKTHPASPSAPGAPPGLAASSPCSAVLHFLKGHLRTCCCPPLVTAGLPLGAPHPTPVSPHCCVTAGSHPELAFVVCHSQEYPC